MQTGHRQLQTGGEPLTRAGGHAGAVRCGACAAAGVGSAEGSAASTTPQGRSSPTWPRRLARPTQPAQRPQRPSRLGDTQGTRVWGSSGVSAPVLCVGVPPGGVRPGRALGRHGPGGGLGACGQRPNKRISQIYGASVATGCTDAPETALPGVLGQQESGRSDGQGRCGPGRARSWVRSGRPTGVLTRISRWYSGTAVVLGSKGVHLACNGAAAGAFSPPSAEVATGGSAVGAQNRKIGLGHPKTWFWPRARPDSASTRDFPSRNAFVRGFRGGRF